MQLEYSYTAIDPETRCARTFTVACDDRRFAHSLITTAVRHVNRRRLQEQVGAKLVPVPSLDSLEAAPARNARIGHVSVFA